MCKIFNDEQRKKAEFILTNDFSRLSELRSDELKDLGVLWAYYSGKIEGSTYTYVETDTLIKQGLTSTSGIATYEDARMLKNLYNTFMSCIKEVKENGKIDLHTEKIFQLHTSLTGGLLEHFEQGQFRSRAVRISGTNYIPHTDKNVIAMLFSDFLYKKDSISNPIERAIYCHCNIARLQPFLDGNKRTSRLIESIIMMNYNIIPVYSNKAPDIDAYKSGLLHFYETEDYSKYVDYSLNKQIQQIELLSGSSYDVKHPKQKEENKTKGLEPDL